MRKISLWIVFSLAIFIQGTYGQDSSASNQALLTQYYNIKDALVAGDGSLAAAKAQDFIKIANTIDYKVISEGNINALLKDATSISETKDLNKQRQHFVNLSNNFVALAKATKLSDSPIYQQYCPMKKANWLSSEQAIKNPYYGNAMLTCGSVVETIRK